MSRTIRSLLILLILTLLILIILYWPHVRNELFVLSGARDEAGGWYGFHSGIGGAAYVSVIPAGAVLYWHSTCHASPWCLRHGKYEAAGGMFKLCQYHHPDMKDHVGSRLELIHRLHSEHKERLPKKIA